MQLNLFQMSLLRQRVRAAIKRIDNSITGIELSFIDNSLKVECSDEHNFLRIPDLERVIKYVVISDLNGIQLSTNKNRIVIT